MPPIAQHFITQTHKPLHDNKVANLGGMPDLNLHTALLLEFIASHRSAITSIGASGDSSVLCTRTRLTKDLLSPLWLILRLVAVCHSDKERNKLSPPGGEADSEDELEMSG